MSDETDDGTDPFERLDFQRLARHEKMLAIYRELPDVELLTDINMLLQLLTVRSQQRDAALTLRAARELHAQGAGHECSEWLVAGRCQVCEREVLP